MNSLWKSTLNVSVVITIFMTLNSWKMLLKARDAWWSNKRKECIKIQNSKFFLFIHSFLSPVISPNIHRYFNNIFHGFKVLKKVITAETLNINFYLKFIKFWIICFFQLFFILSDLFPHLLPSTLWVQCSPMAQETRVRSQVESYQRLKSGTWYHLRCPWCNVYRRRKWTRRHEFKSWTRLIAFHIALIPLGKVWIQLFSLQLWVNSRAD